MFPLSPFRASLVMIFIVFPLINAIWSRTLALYNTFDLTFDFAHGFSLLACTFNANANLIMSQILM